MAFPTNSEDIEIRMWVKFCRADIIMRLLVKTKGISSRSRQSNIEAMTRQLFRPPKFDLRLQKFSKSSIFQSLKLSSPSTEPLEPSKSCRHTSIYDVS